MYLLYFMKLTPRAAMMGEQPHECRLKLYILWNLDCIFKRKKYWSKIIQRVKHSELSSAPEPTL